MEPMRYGTERIIRATASATCRGSIRTQRSGPSARPSASMSTGVDVVSVSIRAARTATRMVPDCTTAAAGLNDTRW